MDGEEELADESTGYSVRAVERACSILDLLQQRIDGVSLGEIAEAVDLPKSSAFRYIWTLERRRYVQRDPVTDDLHLGLAFLPIRARQFELLAQQARPHLEALRDQFDETINIGYLDGNRVVYLDVVESRRSVRLAARPGDRDPIHSTALGKAIVAHIPETAVRSILDADGLPAYTPSTITDVDTYLAELEIVRNKGYALDDGENEPDGRCVAVSLGDERFHGGLSLSAPAARLPMHSIDAVVTALTKISELLVSEMGAPPEIAP